VDNSLDKFSVVIVGYQLHQPTSLAKK